MEMSNFFSKNSYLYLPTKNNPRVALAIDNKEVAKNAFKLYNPFSVKAKILKKIQCFLYCNSNLRMGKSLKKENEKSKFIDYLERELNSEIIVSLYFATIKDKIVIQLQTRDAKIIGYLKYPLNELGLIHVKNEIRAFEILSERGIVDGYLLSKEYEGKPFLLLKELDGDIGMVSKENVHKILKEFHQDESYRLADHPRVSELKKMLLENGLDAYASQVNDICQKSIVEFQLVYEHGDFTPWNIVKVKEHYVPFDFEYFVEEGLEYFDLIKYYYNTGRLLHSKEREALIEYLVENLDCAEALLVIRLFLMKEIILNIDSSEDEKQLLESLGEVK
jgi:hypothetical protein